MSTTTTNTTPLVEYLLGTEHSTIETYDGRTEVIFFVPVHAGGDTVEERTANYEVFKAACAASPAYQEHSDHYRYTGRIPSVLANTRTLATAGLIPVLDVVHSDNDRENGVITFTIAERWAYVAPDGKFLTGGGHGRLTFDTPKAAEAAFKKWTKAAEAYDRDTDFIQEYQYDIQDLASMNADPAINPAPGADTKVGDVVTVWGHGRQRLGLVAEVTKTRVKVAWTTPTAVKSGADPVINWHKKQVVEAAPVDSVAGMVEAFDRQPNHVVERYLAQS